MPTALLIHGIGNGPAGMWRTTEWLDAHGFETSAPAILGHGDRPAAESYALDDYAEDLLASGDFDLVVGHSLGGSIATVAADRRPAWAKRIVLIDPALYIPAEIVARAGPGGVAELSLTRDELSAANPHWDERDIDAKHTEARRVLPEAVSRTFDHNPTWDLRPHAAGLTSPTLLITGEPARGSLLPTEIAESVAASNPLITWRVVEGTGHHPHRDNPAETERVLRDWLVSTTH